MSKLRWEAAEAKRLLAEAAIRHALTHIESAAGTGGAASVNTTWYIRALHSVREAERLLTLSERR